MAYFRPQCRLEPSATIRGSWNPIGFHGHDQAKHRGDVRDLYRQLAKPVQPCVFQKRIQLPSEEHVFSKHDNRNAILGLRDGAGKRRVTSWNTYGQKDLLMWMPLKEEFDKAQPLLSTYKTEYRGIPVDEHSLEQKYVPRLGLLFGDRPPETTYRFDMGQQNPHRRPGPTCLPLPTGNQLLKVLPNYETVATCLTWERPVQCRRLFDNTPDRAPSTILLSHGVCPEKPCGQVCIH